MAFWDLRTEELTGRVFISVAFGTPQERLNAKEGFYPDIFLIE